MPPHRWLVGCRGWRVRGGLWRVHLPRLPIPVMAPKRSASTSPELSATSSEPSDSSSGRLCEQPVTHYYDTAVGLSDGRAVDRMPDRSDAVEMLRRRHAEAHPVRLDSSGAGPSDLRHCYMCETRDSVKWYYWPPKGGRNPGQPPHRRVCASCRASLHNGSLVKEEHRASRCGLDYDCPDGAYGPNRC